MAAARWLALAFACWSGAAVARPCRATEQALVGAWKVADQGAFEEMAFARENGERVFASWLHHRPEVVDARWSLAGCALRIAHERETAIRFDFEIVRLSRNLLILRDRAENATYRYRRIRA